MYLESDEVEKKKAAQRATWQMGDFGALARTFGAVEAQLFVDRLPPLPGAAVLDIACGTGAATLPLARRGASVTGLDMVPKHLAEAEAQAKREDLSIRFDEGFAEHLPYPDQTFDVVVSMFGAMFSQKPDTIVSEIARVLKPGGLLAMANWTTSGFSGLMSKIPAAYLPPSATAISPMLWGEEETVRNRLGGSFASINCQPIVFEWRTPWNAIDSAKFFITNAGPVQALMGRLDKQNCLQFHEDMVTFWAKENISHNSDRTVIKNEYLEVTALRS